MNVTVGQITERSLKVTPQRVELYAQVTGDRNPPHFDREWTARTRFGRLIAQGGRTTGLLHALVAMELPGPGSVFMEPHWQFPAPVYIGDTITAWTEVAWVHEREPIARLAMNVTNQDGAQVLAGEATIYQAEARA